VRDKGAVSAVMKRVLVIPGDGIGPEVIGPSVDILSEITNDIEFEFTNAGRTLFEKTGESIANETLDKAKEADAIFFGATATARDERYVSPILTLRKKLDLYANVRPIKALSTSHSNIDMIIIRENTEGLYTRREERDLEGVTTYRRVTTMGCSRIVNFAFSWCKKHSRQRLTCVHKANVLRLSDGMFLGIFEEEARRYNKMECSEMLVDTAALRMVMAPQRFDTIVTLNLYGDILSDLAAGLIGGLGFVPSANIGDNHALFEPAHGSAPDIAGRGIANPFAALMSASMMLEYLGNRKQAELLNMAIENTISGNLNIVDKEGRCNMQQVIDSMKNSLRKFRE